MINKVAMIAIIGRANVGKSTLTNSLTGEKVAIVTPKPQTTRNRIFAVFNHEDTQMILLDTPGFHKAKTRLGEYMVGVVKNSVTDVDAIVLVVEPYDNVGIQEELLIEHIEKTSIPSILVINKIDTIKAENILPIIETYSKRHKFDAIIPICAKNGDGLPELLDTLIAYGKTGQQLFPDGVSTDQPEKQIIAEIIREKLLICLEDEIPHGTAIEIDKFSERNYIGVNASKGKKESGNKASNGGNQGEKDSEIIDDSIVIDIEAVIYCEKKSHKGIIIGKNGSMLKKIGKYAREDIENFMGAKVNLQTWVKVKENWRDSQAMIRNLGYT
ncbi:MAG: GTPase Era [Oscillospiraceae bacterium]|nr:GTPase Era [Oscillospiraceae bacterium]